ncbi:LiaF-related protein [Actinotalea sp. M2MS4P-6]|uniref:PspC domain-containing protein n=1 Tax=Actinotalea sp. M2MS4P-6 TaxID=2983762 RepID=UPI0021E3D4CC|nr:PspC domain-containing protein [Actinotalea sp. M2MS4P-6]MCV2395478.1 LiaF-related protein [Actinotalea sp. M2MS4P-6]
MDETSTQPTEPTPRRSGADGFFDSVRGIGVVRTDDRWIGGVAGGIARRFAIDPVVVRGLIGVSVLLGGIGLVLYGIAWLLLPEESDGRIHAQQLLHGDVNVAVLGAVGAIVLGLSVPVSGSPWFWGGGGSELAGWFRGLAWLAAVAIVVVVVVMALRSRGPGTAPRTSLPRPMPYPPAGGPGPYPTTPPPATSRPFDTTQPIDTSESTVGAPTGGTMSTDTAGGPEAPASAHPTSGAPTYGVPAYGPPTYGGPTGQPGGPGAPGGPGYPWNPAPWPPPGPSTALPRPDRTGGGIVFGVVGALTLLTLAGLMYAERTGLYDGPVATTTLTVGLALLGLGIAYQGLRGRRAGGLTAIAIIGLLVAAPMTAAARWDGEWIASAGPVGDVSATPTSVTSAEEGVRVGAGTVVLDLTEVPLGSDPVVVPVRVGAGDLTLVIPADVAVVADVALGAGEVTWLDDEAVSGLGNEPHTYLSPAAEEGEPTRIELDVRVGLGTVTVEED